MAAAEAAMAETQELAIAAAAEAAMAETQELAMAVAAAAAVAAVAANRVASRSSHEETRRNAPPDQP